MRLLTNLFTLTLALLLLAPGCRAADQKPVWRIDLHALRSQRPQDELTVKFSGPYLVVYSASLVYSGSEGIWFRPPRLVFDSKTGQPFPKERPAELRLPAWDECPRTRFRKAHPAVNIIDCRKQMTIEQIGGIGLKEVDLAEFYLLEPGKEKTLIFRAHKRCQPGDPRFISDELILLRPCNDNVVVDKTGRKVYDMPSLSWYYLTLNRDGTRFAVYERDGSLFSLYVDRLRVKVFRSSDGKKLFDYRWHPADEGINDGRVALSDDGSLLAIIRGEEVLGFALPIQK